MNKDDLLDWLDRQVPTASRHRSRSKVKGCRYFDDELWQKALRGRTKKWPNPLQAATALAVRERGGPVK